MSKIIAYTDGASRGNPGDAGIGILFVDEQDNVVKEIHEYIGKATNNVAEYTAMLKALKVALEMNFREIDIISDSELMVKQIKGEYKVKNEGLKPLYRKACKLLKGFRNFTFQHVRREHNKRADELANRGIDEAFCERKT